MTCIAVVLAAGMGTRMKSLLPKVLHPVLGDPSLLWVLRSLPGSVARALVVVHHGKEQVQEQLEAWSAAGLLPCPVQAVDQGEPLGTGHAVKACTAELDRLGAERVLILSGDVPLLPTARLESLLRHHGALLTMDLEEPGGYGRVIQAADGRLVTLTEAKDAPPEILAIKRVNGGAYALPWGLLRTALGSLSRNNAQSEYYLTDAVAALARHVPVHVEPCPAEELTGMNSRKDQALLDRLAQAAINARWMEEGVSFQDPSSSWIGPRVQLAQDVSIEPGVRLTGACRVGAGTRLGQGCVVSDCEIGTAAEIRPYSVLEQATVGDRCIVGPFARLREGTLLEEGVHVGNFVETKKAHLKPGAKANHLTYLGDCEVGEGSNVGAGVITCNYDGFKKHRTIIGKHVFVGSDIQLIAPVSIGDGAILGAGSTITEDIPANALALTRPPLTLKTGGALRLREKLRKNSGVE
jgi:bifunctional UDP-N-acetylglucosamine pyrophosphorylase/glucosamine-1-phosphate N-acetyltransferase